VTTCTSRDHDEDDDDMSGLGLDYSSSEEDERDAPEAVENTGRTAKEERPSTTLAPKVASVVNSMYLPSASALFAGDASTVAAFAKEAAAPAAQRPSGKRPAPTPILNPRQGRQSHPTSVGKVNTLLPPQLRGRANHATQDLEGLGLREPKPKSR
jgi:hypothetical protein